MLQCCAVFTLLSFAVCFKLAIHEVTCPHNMRQVGSLYGLGGTALTKDWPHLVIRLQFQILLWNMTIKVADTCVSMYGEKQHGRGNKLPFYAHSAILGTKIARKSWLWCPSVSRGLQLLVAPHVSTYMGNWKSVTLLNGTSCGDKSPNVWPA